MDGQQLPPHMNGYFSVTREAMPGVAGGLLVHFEKHSWLKPKMRWTDEERKAHAETGQPIREDVDCIIKTTDGGLNVDPPIRVKKRSEEALYFDPDTGFLTDDIERFPRQWAAYQAGMSGEEQIIGWSLKHYFKDSPAKIENYRYHKIYTVEQLADLPTTLAQKIGLGAITDSQKAQKDLEKARIAGPGIAHAEALHEAEENVRILKEQVAQLMANAEQNRNKGNKKGKIHEEE